MGGKVKIAVYRVVKLKIYLLLVLYIFVSLPIFCDSDYKSINGLLKRYNGDFEWNPVLGIGKIKLSTHEIVFKENFPFVLIDYKYVLPVSFILFRDKKVLVTVDTIEKIEGYIKKLGSTKLRVAVIMIDPGHGGRDPGTRGVNRIGGKIHKLKEKDIVLKVGLELRKLLKKRYPNKKIVMTRTTDIYPSLEDRVSMANAIKLHDNEAMIFISIHANASINKRARGFEIWYLPPEYRRKLIDREDVANGNKEIVPILNSMLEEEYTIESITLARYILEGLKNNIGDRTISRGLKAREWYVVRKAKMPSVLIEIGFVTNPQEMLLLENRDYLQKVTKGIYNGIVKFVHRFESGNGITE